MSYVVRLQQFEGPLDLLLYLIQREEMDIYDIPIARITQQYLEHIEMMEKLDLQPAGDFLVMAATLLRIKARMLLPVARPDEASEEDPRAELVQRLLEYKKFKEAAQKLQEREAEARRRYTRPLDTALLEEVQKLGAEETFEVSLPSLMKALQGVLQRIETVATHEVELEPISLEEKVDWLANLMQEKRRLAFTELFAGNRSRIEVIVTFMAILELIKAGRLKVHQADNFSELWIFVAEAAPEATGTEAAVGEAGDATEPTNAHPGGEGG